MKFKQHVVASAMLVMKIALIQMFMFVIFVYSLYAKEANAQNVLEKKITLTVQNESLEQVISRIKGQTNADFSFSISVIKNDLIKQITVTNKTLGDFLKYDLSIYHIGYSVVGDQIVLYRSNSVAAGPVKGRVLDDKGIPLPGATVKVKGTSTATSTNNNGEYSIIVNSPADVLVFSSIGYETQERTVGNDKTINVTLKDASGKLDEVVVVAFGKQKQITRTGSISTVTTKDLLQSPAANISNSLVGRLPGLFASQASGEPGADQSTLRIRGVSTFSGSTDPLVMVDGVETPNYNNIDPNEIETVSILKDASATAVYGIRGANGVLLITTKRGKNGPPTLNYTFNEAVNSFTALRKPMDAYTYANSLNQAIANDAYVSGSAYVPRFSAAEIQKFKDGSDPIFYPNVNWYDVLLRKTSAQQQHNLNIRGGTNLVKYYVSAGYFNQQGLFKDTRNLVPGFDSDTRYGRFNFRSNFDFKLSKRLNVSVDFSSTNEQRTGNNSVASTVIENISRANPVDAPLPVDGKIVNAVSNASNPLAALLQNGYRNMYSNYLNATLKLDHKLDFITQGLNLRANVNYQSFSSINYLNSVQLVSYLAKRQPDGTISYIPNKDDAPYGFSTVQDKNRKEVLEFGFDYDRSFGNHAVTGLILYRQSKLYNPNLAFLVPNGYQSVVSRVTYNYKSRYLAEVSGSYEGTENFAPGKRFGFFPSYSIGWVPSEESFFPKGGVVNFLKIRATYGQVGNDKIGGDRFLYNPTSYTYGTVPGYYFGDIGSTYKQYNGAIEGKSGNPDLTWERAIKVNGAIDIYMFNNNLTFTAEVFHEQRSNILAVPQSVALITGYLLPAYNLGKMSNKGIEGDVTFKNNIGKFSYQVSGNFSFARNKILFRDEVPQLYSYRNTTGQRNGQYYGLVADGFFNSWAEVNAPNRPVYYSNYKLQPGDVKFKDINGDGIINDDDQVPIGYSNVPEITYGFSLRGAYKGFDFSVLFQGVGNVSIAYSRRYYSAFFDNPTAGAVDYLDQSWTQARYDAGLPINFPRFSTANGTNPDQFPSTLFIVNAQYLRLKNAEIGYTLRAAFLNKIALKSARFFVNGNNLITWSNVLPGIDPENPALGTNLEPYPLVRTINFGVNAGF